MKRSNRNKKRTVILIVTATVILVLILLFMAILTFRNQNRVYGFAREIPEEERLLRLKLVETAEG